MKELQSSVIHHIEQAARKAGVRFDADCRAELEADFSAAEDRIATIERRLSALTDTVLEAAKIDALRQQVAALEAGLEDLREGTADVVSRLDTPDWRQRR